MLGHRLRRGRLRALTLIDRTAGTNIGDMTGNGGLANAFDGTTSQTGPNSAGLTGEPTYVGKTLAGPKIFGRAIVYGSNNEGFILSANPSTTLNIRGKSGSAPANSADGTLLGTTTFTDTTNESAGRQIDLADNRTTYDHLWVEITTGSSSGKRVAELVLYEWL